MGGFAKRLAVVAGLCGVWLVAGPVVDSSIWTVTLAQQAPPCGPNPIVCENQLTGSPQSEWDIAGAGDLNALQGFATDISVNAGATAAFKIKASQAFSIDIYRLGYYGGAGARKVASIASEVIDTVAAQNQPECLTDVPSGLVDCGTWSVVASWNTSSATSGVYIAKLSQVGSPAVSSHIYFIVRDDARKADLLFQTSDTTWQAYNAYGGHSLYCGGQLPNAAGDYSCATRGAKVSYNRPFDTRAHDARSFLFNAEYPMIRWLEANGYDVKYWTGVDTDRYGLDAVKGLTSAVRPKAFLSVGHDEYWSAGQRANVERARDGGVNLAFFSGNEMFWKTRFEPSIDGSNTAFRTLVSYKETFGNGTRVDPDPASPWTGTWRDPRFPQAGGGVPENALTGQLWTVNCCSERIHVPASMKDLRFWRNTAVANLAPASDGYRTSVDTLGYEWDEDVDNGFRPSGLVRMSSTTLVAPERVIDHGINVAQGAATHSLTLYRHHSGALVFGAGTVQWSWGLDAVHDLGGPAIDTAMQQATVNLFADMGVQAALLEAGLTAASMSTDILAPASTIVSPAAGSTVDSGTRLTISGTAFEQGGGVLAGVEVSVDSGATWRRANLLPSGAWTFAWTPGSPGSANIRSRAFDDSGNAEVVGAGTSLTVGPGTCPCASLWRPTAVPTVPSAADGNAVEVGTKFFSDVAGYITGVRFYKSAANTGTHVGNLWSSAGTRLGTVTFANETPSGWQQANFPAPVPIAANTTYVISYHTNVGSYSADAGYFATDPIDSPPLHAPTNPVAGGNGVFVYGPSQFPNGTFNATNYWVDVVFAASVDDAIPPVISRVAARTIDSSKVTVTWTTDEEATSKVQYSVDPAILDGTTTLPPGTQTVTAGTFVTQHSLTLTGLAPNTTYYYRVISVDRSGNAADTAAPSVTVPGPTLRDTAAADFSAGTVATAYVAETSDGEVILAPAAASEFSGTTLPSGWSDVPYAAGGDAFLGNGLVLVDGSRLGTCIQVTGGCREDWTFTPGHRLEFVATFTGDANQHSGFAQNFASSAEPWAIFSTLGGGALTARTNTGLASAETFLGVSYLGFPHKYTIDWNDTSVLYAIDDVVVATHNLVVAGPLRPLAASDFSVFGGNVIVDWMRLTPYAGSGAFESRVFDANALVNWNTVQWLADTPSGTSLAVSIRTGASADPADGTWSTWQPVGAPGPLTLRSRYIQYRAELASSHAAMTPTLEDIIISTGHAPVAGADAAAVQANGSITFAAAGPGSLIANDSDADVGDVLRVVAVSQPLHGAALLNDDGTVTYAAAPDFAGTDTFTYVVSDGLLTATATVTLTVGATNAAPVARADAFVIDEDTLLSVAAPGVLANDTDVDADPLAAILVASPAHGTVVLTSTGAFTYTPQPNYAGPDFFTYKVNDGSADSNVAAVEISITQVNDPPIPEADTYSTTAGEALTIAAPGVLANDHDVEVEETAPLRAVLGRTADAHGTVTLGADGGFTYTPETGYLGAASFTYTAVDHLGATGAPATVTITVQMETVSQPSASGGTVATGTTVSAGDPLQTAVTTPAAATVSIGQGVISSTALPGNFTFLNRQVDVTVRNPDGTEFIGSIDRPLTLSFLIDASLIPPGESAATLRMFRNDVLVPECLGSTTIPSAQRDPCVTTRQTNADGSVTIAVLTTHASHWNLGVASTDPTPVARADSSYVTAPGTPLVVPSPGVLGNDIGRTQLKASPLGAATGGTVVLAESGGFSFTPSAGFCGAATFGYTATDAAALQSAAATATIRINCAPVAGDDSFTVLEDSAATIFAVLANDNDPEEGAAALRITAVSTAAHGVLTMAPDARSVTYTPAADFFGPDTFTYTVSDGRGGSSTASATVTVVPVNDAPGFVKGPDRTVPEDAGLVTVAGWATAISAGPANESGQALSFRVSTSNAPLFNAPVQVTSDGTLTFTPAPDANGSATVTVALSDDGGTANGAADTSAPQTFTITVTPVNDAPSFTKGLDQTVLEDSGPTAVTGWATGISAGPADERGQAVQFVVTTTNPALFSAAPEVALDGTLTFTPAANASGTALVSVTLRETATPAIASAVQTFTITVAPVNDPPAFVKGANQTVLEDSGAQLVAAWATGMTAGPAPESKQAVRFVVTADNLALFSVQPSITPAGALSYTPAPNANGSASVSVVLRDDGGTADGGADASAPQTFTITVTAVNDAPRFTKGSDQTVNEDAGLTSVTGWAAALSAGPPNESAQTLTFTLTASNPALFATSPAISAAGVLTFAPAANASGSSTVTVVLSDDGGTADGGVNAAAAQTFLITVNSVNDAPSFTKGADQTVLEDSGAQSVAWATSMSAGPADEAGQALSFVVATDNAALFSAQPKIAPNGVLTFTPASNAAGSAIVTVRLQDDGLTANGGTDTSAPQTFVIRVTGVNDAPAFTKGGDQTVQEDAPVQTITPWATAISAGGADESGQTLTFEVTNTNNALFAVQPAVRADGTLSYTPAANAFGSAVVTVTLHDSGGTLDNGIDIAAPQTFTITINAVNDVPSFSKGVNQTVLEDAGAQSVTWATGISAGAANETQVLTFIVSNSNTALFSAQPQISAAGALTYTPAPNANGIATVTAQLRDDGGVANGGVDTSAAQTFTISVMALNDTPGFTKGPDQIVLAGAGPQTVTGWATGITPGPADEAQQVVDFLVTTDKPGLFAAGPAIAPNGTLTYTPAASGSGAATVSVRVHDNGGTANGGIDTSAAQAFTITLPFTTTTTLASPTASPTTYGQAVVLNATVTSAGGTPTGSIDFLDNGALLGTVALVNGAASLTTTAIGAGTARTITAAYRPTPMFVTSSATLTRAVTAAATTSTATITPSAVQYSDVVTFETTLTPGNLGNTLPAQSASFKIGTQIVGTAPFVWDTVAGVLRARYTGPLVEGATQTGQLKPGSKPVAVVYNGVSPNYTVANRTSSMSITREDATVAYAGDTSVICTTNCSAVPVVLAARVTQAADGSLGDIRNATVAFVNRTTGLTIATVPVAADGTASATWTVNLGTAASQTTKIGMVVGNYYIRSSTLDDGTVVITKK